MPLTTLATPILQKINGVLRQILPESIASQIKFANGTDLETRFNALENSVSQQTVSYVKANIAARDAMDVSTLHVGDQVWVVDASADATVTSGAAKYIVESISGSPAAAQFVKTAEAESMDLVIAWADIQNKPTNTVTDIDNAVTATKQLVGHELTYDSSVPGGLMVDGVAVGAHYGATVGVAPTDAGFDAAVAALNLPDGAILTVVVPESPSTGD